MILLDISHTDPQFHINIDEDEKRNFICINCKTKITQLNYLITLFENKSNHTFTNRFGFSFNILTFNYCESYIEITAPELIDTWFPGYGWSIINCSKCNSLLGWKYKNDFNIFFGLIRDQIVLI